MPSKSLPYERFGSYILFKKIETDPLSELWRAGRIVGESVTDHFALLRFVGGDARAFKRSTEHAGRIATALTGTAVVKKQEIDQVDGVAFAAWEYGGGRSLNHILTAAVGTSTMPANPIPVDQALAIGEKVAFSVETTGSLKQDGRRIFHGGVIPHLVWITEDGDIRTAGQQLHEGLIASLRHPAIATHLAGFFAPEIRQKAEPTQSSEVFSIGAILYALLTGNPPPDALTASAFEPAIKGAKLMVTHDPVPPEILQILEKSLTLDPATRYSRPGAVREAISSLTHGDSYAPTTFNLAFYIHNLLREEMEIETKEKRAELETDTAPYLVPDPPPEPRVAAVPLSMATAEQQVKEERSGKGLLLAVVLVVAIGGSVAGWYFTVGSKKGSDGSATQPVNAIADATPARIPPPIVEPLVSSLDSGAEPSEILDEGEAGEEMTPEAKEQADRDRLIEEEINRRLQEEMMKLQADYDRKLKTATTPAPAATRAQEPATKESSPEPTTEKPAAATPDLVDAAESSTAPPLTTPAAAAPKPEAAATSPSEAVSTVKEGDLVEIGEVDSPPRLLKSTPPEYPALAARQRAEATIILSALISETGKVLEVRILRGDSRRLGLDEAAVGAVKKSIYSPAIKNGKKVRTWMPVPVMFQASRRR